MYNQTVPSQEEYCGKLSVTEFELLNEYHEKNLALYKVTLHTGRTHQIRVHFSDAGFPLHGDPLYNPNFFTPHKIDHSSEDYFIYRRRFPTFGEENQILGLQAYKLSFPNPFIPGQIIACEIKNTPIEWEV